MLRRAVRRLLAAHDSGDALVDLGELRGGRREIIPIGTGGDLLEQGRIDVVAQPDRVDRDPGGFGHRGLIQHFFFSGAVGATIRQEDDDTFIRRLVARAERLVPRHGET